MCKALWQRKLAQRCDSDDADSILLQRWQWQRLDISGYDTNVTAMAADSAVTVVWS